MMCGVWSNFDKAARAKKEVAEGRGEGCRTAARDAPEGGPWVGEHYEQRPIWEPGRWIFNPSASTGASAPGSQEVC